VIVAAICQPPAISWAVVPSCARAIVRSSPRTTETRTISALSGVATAFGGQTVALNGATGKRAPCPLATERLVPLDAGVGGVATVE
jgi:hypothetical protein